MQVRYLKRSTFTSADLPFLTSASRSGRGTTKWIRAIKNGRTAASYILFQNMVTRLVTG